ncbi:MAG: hypothetical protein K8W52_02755 [Deltaproteobacteria bacterium]|nr:hypothetical protein [Deltaproteobacteria bacterium]
MNTPDPTQIAANATALKVHLRVVSIGHTTYRVVTLRPSMGVRFASNYFHAAWHIVTGVAGAHVLGRLLWGLAFQRQPGTIVLIDAPHLVTTPFEADPSDPILLMNTALTRFDRDDLARLARSLRRAPVAPRTLRWHTFGMIAAFARPRPRHYQAPPTALTARERISRTAGFICYTAPPAMLREQARSIFDVSVYHPLVEDPDDWRYEGEVQVLPNFDDAVAAARVARREVVGDRAIESDDELQVVYDQRDIVTARRRRAREAAKRR